MRTRLRQIAVAAVDLAATEHQLSAAFGVPLCARDPGVAEFGLENALFAIGDQFVEVVAPVVAGTSAQRLIERRGGDTGYMVIIEVDDLAAARRQAAAADVPVVFEAIGDSIVGLHLDPRPLATLVSLDQAETWGEWPWAGDDWRRCPRSTLVTGLVAAEVASPDPERTAAVWAEVLGAEASSVGSSVGSTIASSVVPLDDGEIRFVETGEGTRGLVAVMLKAAPGAAPIDTTIGGTRFVSV